MAVIFLATSGMFLLYDLAVKYNHNVIVRTAVHSARILGSFFPAAFRGRLFQAEETLPMEIVSIHEKTNRARLSSSATSLEFVKSIFLEPINTAIAKPTVIMKQCLVSPADSDEKVAIDENSIYTVNELVDLELIVDLFSCATVMFSDIASFTSWSSNRNLEVCLPTVGTTIQGV